MNTFVASLPTSGSARRRERISSACSTLISDVGYGRSSFTRRDETVFFSVHCLRAV